MRDGTSSSKEPWRIILLALAPKMMQRHLQSLTCQIQTGPLPSQRGGLAADHFAGGENFDRFAEDFGRFMGVKGSGVIHVIASWA